MFEFSRVEELWRVRKETLFRMERLWERLKYECWINVVDQCGLNILEETLVNIEK